MRLAYTVRFVYERLLVKTDGRTNSICAVSDPTMDGALQTSSVGLVRNHAYSVALNINRNGLLYQVYRNDHF
jgi:hypothetical protein